MHVLFAVDPSCLQVATSRETPSEWRVNALVRCFMRLSLLNSLIPFVKGKNTSNNDVERNRCAMRFLDNERGSIRTRRSSMSLADDFFEPWTSKHFDRLAKELSTESQSQTRSSEVKAQDDVSSLLRNAGMALQLAAHQVFSEAGRTNISSDEFCLIVAPLALSKLLGKCDPDCLMQQLEALCSSKAFPTAHPPRLVILDISELVDEEKKSRVDCDNSKNALRTALTSKGIMACVLTLEQVICCSRLNIPLESMLQFPSKDVSPMTTGAAPVVVVNPVLTMRFAQLETNSMTDGTIEESRKEETAGNVIVVEDRSNSGFRKLIVQEEMELDDVPASVFLRGVDRFVVAGEEDVSWWFRYLITSKRAAVLECKDDDGEQDERNRWFFVPASLGFGSLFKEETIIIAEAEKDDANHTTREVEETEEIKVEESSSNQDVEGAGEEPLDGHLHSVKVELSVQDVKPVVVEESLDDDRLQAATVCNEPMAANPSSGMASRLIDKSLETGFWMRPSNGGADHPTVRNHTHLPQGRRPRSQTMIVPCEEYLKLVESFNQTTSATSSFPNGTFMSAADKEEPIKSQNDEEDQQAVEYAARITDVKEKEMMMMIPSKGDVESIDEFIGRVLKTQSEHLSKSIIIDKAMYDTILSTWSQRKGTANEFETILHRLEESNACDLAILFWIRHRFKNQSVVVEEDGGGFKRKLFQLLANTSITWSRGYSDRFVHFLVEIVKEELLSSNQEGLWSEIHSRFLADEEEEGEGRDGGWKRIPSRQSKAHEQSLTDSLVKERKKPRPQSSSSSSSNRDEPAAPLKMTMKPVVLSTTMAPPPLFPFRRSHQQQPMKAMNPAPSTPVVQPEDQRRSFLGGGTEKQKQPTIARSMSVPTVPLVRTTTVTSTTSTSSSFVEGKRKELATVTPSSVSNNHPPRGLITATTTSTTKMNESLSMIAVQSRKRVSLNHFTESLANPDFNMPQVTVPMPEKKRSKNPFTLKKAPSIMETPTVIHATPHAHSNSRSSSSIVMMGGINHRVTGAVSRQLFDTPTSATRTTAAVMRTTHHHHHQNNDQTGLPHLGTGFRKRIGDSSV